MSEFGTIVDRQTVEFERLLEGPIERVWRFITERQFLATWLGDGDLLELNGEFVLNVEGPDLPHSTGAKIVGVVTKFDPPHAIAFTWNHLAPGAAAPSIPESHVSIELLEAGGKVSLKLRHSRIDPGFTSRLGTGWHAFLDALQGRLLGQPIAPAASTFPALLPEYERRFGAA